MNTHTLNFEIQKSLFWILILGIITSASFNCGVPEKIITEQKSLPTIKFNIQGDADIEGLIFVKPINGFTNEDIRPYKASMEITMNEPINDVYLLVIKKGDHFLSEQLWLQGEDITIVGKLEKERLKIDTVINAPFYYYTNEVFNEYEKITESSKKLEAGNDFLFNEITKTIDSPFSNQLASMFIYNNIDKPERLEQLQKVLDNQSDNIKNHPNSIHENLNQILNVVSIQPKTFKFNNEIGQEVNLPLKRDSIYLLDFWFTHCPPCISDHQIIQSKLASFKESGIKILGISTDYDQSAWKLFLDKKNYNWSNYRELEQEEKTLSEHLGISFFPTYLVVNGDGQILNRNSTLEKSMAFLKASKLMKDEERKD